MIGHLHEQRVAARHHERDERWFERRVFTHRGVHVRLVMMHPDVRQPGREGKRLGCAHADEERAREPGTMHRRHRVELVECRSRLDECLLDDVADELDVGPARDLGHHAAEARVQIGLAGDN